MPNHLPASLVNAQKAGIELFQWQACEWKLELKGSAKHIEQFVGCPVYVFANNGFGDHLFLKRRQASDEFEEVAYEFFHEGPEVKRVDDDLQTLLGLKDRLPSADAYPKA